MTRLLFPSATTADNSSYRRELWKQKIVRAVRSPSHSLTIVWGRYSQIQRRPRECLGRRMVSISLNRRMVAYAVAVRVASDIARRHRVGVNPVACLNRLVKCDW